MDRNDSIMLSIDSLRIGYGSSLLPSPLTASARRGELVAVIGRNGIGKSTLLRTIVGLQLSLGGSVRADKKDISDYSQVELAKKIGYISTEIVNVSNMKVCDLVALGRYPYTNWIGRIDENEILEINRSIEKTGLKGFEERYISELSDGERQRAMIARVVAQDTDILIMDEPTAFLDVISKYEAVNLLSDLASDGKTIIFSTHDFNIALSHADRIWLMLDDKLVEGAPEDLVLKGLFEKLFKSEIVEFNRADASFFLPDRSGDSFYIEGEGLLYFWTKKALHRIGCSVTDKKIIPLIKTPESLEGTWELVTPESTFSRSSLFDLLRMIRKNMG